MAITKILARRGRLDICIKYVLSGDKIEKHVFTAHLNCDPGRKCRQMLDTKRAVDKEHIHAHLVFNSVNAHAGEKYHSNAQSYYRQIRAISDRLCREHGLAVIMEGATAKAVSYIEWLRQSKGHPTFRTMPEADLRTAIQDANDLADVAALAPAKQLYKDGLPGWQTISPRPPRPRQP